MVKIRNIIENFCHINNLLHIMCQKNTYNDTNKRYLCFDCAVILIYDRIILTKIRQFLFSIVFFCHKSHFLIEIACDMRYNDGEVKKWQMKKAA